ncbi:V-type H+-transporting ATPase subunit F [Nematocida sp. AWRm77]|nr:V-type H+-transporting ATPase subunit F [Nematocida sp. AWRm77]
MSLGSALSDRTKVAVLADEATVNGFKLTGVNGPEWSSQSAHGVFNYFHAVADEADSKEAESKFQVLLERKEIAIIFLGRKVADLLKDQLSARKEVFPIVMEIPSKNIKPSAEEERLMKRLKDLASNK